jgi:hypothetical protein
MYVLQRFYAVYVSECFSYQAWRLCKYQLSCGVLYGGNTAQADVHIAAYGGSSSEMAHVLAAIAWTRLAN